MKIKKINRKQSETIDLNNKIMKVYNISIRTGIAVILLLVIQMMFHVVDVPMEYPLIIITFTSIGTTSLILDRTIYVKQCK